MTLAPLPDAAPFASDPAGWLTHEARDAPHLAALIDGLAQRLRHGDVVLTRFTLHIGTVHPQLAGYACAWNLYHGTCEEKEVRHAALQTGPFFRGPLRPVIEHGAHVRRDPRRPDAQAEFPLMAELAGEGITDYVARSLGRMGGAHIAITYATDAPGGFSPRGLAILEGTFPLLLLHLDMRIMTSIARNALDAYLGRRAGARVLAGEIVRGKGERIDAVIWASDLRDYTGLADRLSDDAVVRLMNAYFECLVESILAQGGEVLKFIGDGLLAIFPIALSRPADAAEAAIAAARGALAALARLNAESGAAALAIDGAWRPLRTGIALHRGDVFFGNIGAPERVDFTVTGQAVNLAARVEPLTKSLGQAVLVTGPVARLSSEALVPLGQVTLRGVRAPMELFALPPPAGSRPSTSEG